MDGTGKNEHAALRLALLELTSTLADARQSWRTRRPDFNDDWGIPPAVDAVAEAIAACERSGIDPGLIDSHPASFAGVRWTLKQLGRPHALIGEPEVFAALLKRAETAFEHFNYSWSIHDEPPGSKMDDAAEQSTIADAIMIRDTLNPPVRKPCKNPGPRGGYNRASVRPKGWQLLRAIRNEQARYGIALTSPAEDEEPHIEQLIHLRLLARVHAEPRTGRAEHAGLLGLALTGFGHAELNACNPETGLPDATPTPDAAEKPDMRTGRWFDMVTNSHLKADALRKAFDRGKLKKSIKQGRLLLHDTEEVARLWPDHAQKIRRNAGHGRTRADRPEIPTLH